MASLDRGERKELGGRQSQRREKEQEVQKERGLGEEQQEIKERREKEGDR